MDQQDTMLVLREDLIAAFGGAAALNYKLMSFTEDGKIQVVSLLLALGANVDAQIHGSKRTPFMQAAWHGHLDLCSVLLANGADPYAIDNDGRSALDLVPRSKLCLFQDLLAKANKSAANTSGILNSLIPRH